MLGIAQSQDKQEWVYQIAKRLARMMPEKQTRYNGLMLKSAILRKDVLKAVECAERPLDSTRHLPDLICLLIDADELEDASNILEHFERDNPDETGHVRQLRAQISHRLDNAQTLRMTKTQNPLAESS